MPKRCSWTRKDLEDAVKKSTSIRQALSCLGLVEAGGNYVQVKKYMKIYGLDTTHFKGQGWNKGMRGIGRPKILLSDILVNGSTYQSYKLKKRLFKVGLKSQECEECGWAQRADDGRLPLELDHINGDNTDNRIENLRILCPNCHSLKPSHRGLNRKKNCK
jgi:hypothetical protein